MEDGGSGCSQNRRSPHTKKKKMFGGRERDPLPGPLDGKVQGVQREKRTGMPHQCGKAHKKGGAAKADSGERSTRKLSIFSSDI